jgi:hypothetical protein
MLTQGTKPSFTATIGKQRFNGPSWESLTAKLDPAIGFEARDVLMFKNGITQVRIVGRAKTNMYGYRFVTDEGNQISESIYPLEARGRMEKMVELRKALDAAKALYGDQIDELWGELNPMAVRAE